MFQVFLTIQTFYRIRNLCISLLRFFYLIVQTFLLRTETFLFHNLDFFFAIASFYLIIRSFLLRIENLCILNTEFISHKSAFFSHFGLFSHNCRSRNFLLRIGNVMCLEVLFNNSDLFFIYLTIVEGKIPNCEVIMTFFYPVVETSFWVVND